jgi:hypothetical protein
MRNHYPSQSTMIVAARALLLALAAAAVVTGFVVTRKSAPMLAARGIVYSCPMHPAVTAQEPGECPVCRMALEPRAANNAGTHTDEPASLTLAQGKRLAGFDSVSRVKRYESSFDMRAWAWAESRDVGVALYPRDQARMLAPGEEGQFEPESGPRGPNPHGIKVHLGEQDPEPWDAFTMLVRFRLDDHAGAELRPKEIGSVKFALRLRNGLVVRQSAVIQSPEGPYVLMASADRRTFTKRPVQVGAIMYDYADLIGGAREDEYAVALHTFVLDTERRLGRRAAP